MGEYTIEQYRQGAKRARDAGDLEAAEELAQAGLALQKNQRIDFTKSMMLPSADNVKERPPLEANSFGDTTAEITKPYRQNISSILNNSSFDDSMISSFKDVGNLGLNALATGLTGTAGVGGEILSSLGPLFGIPNDKTQERKAVSDLSMGLDVAIPELMGPMGAVKRSIGPMARAAEPKSVAVQRAQAAQDLDIVPNLGTQGRAGAILDAGLESNILTSGRAAQAAETTSDGMQSALDRASQKIGTPTTEEAAGAALREGGDAFVKGFKEKSAKLFNNVDKVIGAETPVSAPNSVKFLTEITKNAEDFPGLAQISQSPMFQKILKDLSDSTFDTPMLTEVPYSALKDLRTAVSEQITAFGAMGNMPQGKLKKLRSAITADMDAAAQAAGPNAVAALDRANKYYAKNREVVKRAISKIAGENVTDEQAYRSFVNMAKGKGRGDIKKLSQLRGSLPKEHWATVAATIVRKMGDVKAGAKTRSDLPASLEFSPSTFLTEWNTTSPKAKVLLTSGNMDQTARRELDKLALAVDGFKEGQRQRNFSKTGNIVTTSALTAGAVTDVVTTGIASGSLYLTSRALTNKGFLKALNDARAGQTYSLRRIAQDGMALSSEASSALRLLNANYANQEGPQ